jgi:hypothetical protein
MTNHTFIRLLTHFFWALIRVFRALKSAGNVEQRYLQLSIDW